MSSENNISASNTPDSGPVEMDQDLMVLAHSMSPACLLSVENFGQRLSLIREMRPSRIKGKQSKKPYNNNVVMKHSQGPLVSSQGL